MNHDSPDLLTRPSGLRMKLPSSRAGARLGRELAAAWLRDRGVHREQAADALQIVAELAANAALHGRVPGRKFLLALQLDDADRVLRIEATDTRAEAVPVPRVPPPDSESGRGLLIVTALADRWGLVEGPAPRKTVWAELDLAGPRPVPPPGEVREPV
ncbi:ATP-binding protein [Streptomyces fradiae]|uniref:ATP-binding protein n=1 Tax=Streptomyces fradiae TaxID=1906 RepID=UPI002943A116|nr:ATP-binding protein [Streptomyces fradiae]WOI62758.1 ATP-binding protein [Streptomyces fradiae]